MPRHSSAVEDYLKAIYEIQQETGSRLVGTAALAEKLHVTRASVTGMLKKLAASPERLIAYTRYRGVRLSPKGEKAALEVVRHHRLLEAYLTTALGYSWPEAGPRIIVVTSTSPGEGKTLTAVALPGAQGQKLTAVVLDWAAGGAIYAATEGAGILRSRDGGKTWPPANAGLESLMVVGLALDPRARQKLRTSGVPHSQRRAARTRITGCERGSGVPVPARRD